MAADKKISAKEAGIAVLKKFEELLTKAEKEHKHIGWDKLHNKLEHEGYSKESADKIDGSIKAKVEKSDQTQPAGAQAQGGSQMAMSEDAGMKGHIKLAKFIGHIQGKRAAKSGMNQDSGNNTPVEPINANLKELDKSATGHEKGINTMSDPSQKSKVMLGTSKAGSQMPFSKDPATRQEDKHDAVNAHKQVLGEMKNIKPKLPG